MTFGVNVNRYFRFQISINHLPNLITGQRHEILEIKMTSLYSTARFYKDNSSRTIV